MKNSKQTLAQALLNQYKFCERMWREDIIDRDYFNGQRVAIMSISASIFGKEITGQIPLEFVKNLEEIANAKPQSNLVEVNRFEAFALHQHFRNKAKEAQQEDKLTLVDSYNQKSSKWLDIACDIEQADADGINKNLVIG
jgi:hypothetical protein